MICEFGVAWLSENVYLADDHVDRFVPLFLKNPMLDDSLEIADGCGIVQE